ncbi:hypothetical protein AB0D10_39170 [Kitasatospora sp. NPDC048545]
MPARLPSGRPRTRAGPLADRQIVPIGATSIIKTAGAAHRTTTTIAKL